MVRRIGCVLDWYTGRQKFVRPPREGIPGVPDGALIKSLKGCVELKEFPRLWWLAFVSICGTAAVFVIQDGGKIIGRFTIHVDDGTWARGGFQTGASASEDDVEDRKRGFWKLPTIGQTGYDHAKRHDPHGQQERC